MQIIPQIYPYAKVIFNIAKESQTVDEWQEFLLKFSEFVTIKEVKLIFKNPSINSKVKEQIVIDYFEKLNLIIDNKKNNFCMLLIQYNRVLYLSYIYDYFINLKLKSEGIHRAKVISFFPFTDEQKKRLLSILCNRFQKKFYIEYETSKDLIGGAIIYVNNLVIDNSGRSMIDKLRKHLKVE